MHHSNPIGRRVFIGGKNKPQQQKQQRQAKNKKTKKISNKMKPHLYDKVKDNKNKEWFFSFLSKSKHKGK